MSEVALTRTCHPVLGEGLLLPSAHVRAQASSLVFACVLHALEAVTRAVWVALIGCKALQQQLAWNQHVRL